MIEAEGLTKRYGDRTAVDGLTFTVRPGMVTGFLGPNGAGKSTTMRLVLGLDAPTSGLVLVHGRHYRDLASPLHEVGALLEARSIHPGRSAFSHLLGLAHTHGIGRRRVQEVIDEVGLSEVARQRAGRFSLGMNQRLGLAAALLGDPATLLLDEPANGLDPEGILWMCGLLKGLAEQGRTVFVSSHLMAEMALTADHLIVVGRGRLLADCGVAEFVDAAALSHVRVRTPHPDALVAALRAANAGVAVAPDGSLEVVGTGMAQIGELAARTGTVLHELAAVQGSLEDAFMELTRNSVEYHGQPHPVADAGLDRQEVSA